MPPVGEENSVSVKTVVLVIVGTGEPVTVSGRVVVRVMLLLEEGEKEGEAVEEPLIST